MKKCFKCGIEKSLDEFYKHSQMGDGHLNKCKECTKLDTKANYRKNIQNYNKYEEERSKNIDRILNRRRRNRLYALRNPDKKRSQAILRGAVIRGLILKPNICSVCNNVNERLQAHHQNYEKPLEVIWLCGKCHRSIHQNSLAQRG
jgi:hypothetical protein